MFLWKSDPLYFRFPSPTLRATCLQNTESFPIKIEIAPSVLWLSYGTGNWKVVFNTRQDQNIFLFSKATRLTLDTRVSFDRATGVWGWLLTSTKGRGKEYVGAKPLLLLRLPWMMPIRGNTLLFSVNHQQLTEIFVVYTRGRWSNFNGIYFANA
jgi:hypothetical protein